MTLAVRAVSELATAIGGVPLAWLGLRRIMGRRTDPAYWWLALAFAVSWLADLAALWVDPWRVSTIYLVSQSGLVGAVFLTRGRASWFLVALTAAGTIAAAQDRRPDLLIHSVAWLGVVWIVRDLWPLGRLRTALVVYFGGGWLAWLGYAVWPGWWSWGALQLARAIGIAIFCVAATETRPALRVVRCGR